MLLHPSQAKCGQRVGEVFSQGKTKFISSLVNNNKVFEKSNIRLT